MTVKTISRYVTREPQILSGEPIIAQTRTPCPLEIRGIGVGGLFVKPNMLTILTMGE
jgi:hypothetical protein